MTQTQINLKSQLMKHEPDLLAHAMRRIAKSLKQNDSHQPPYSHRGGNDRSFHDQMVLTALYNVCAGATSQETLAEAQMDIINPLMTKHVAVFCRNDVVFQSMNLLFDMVGRLHVRCYTSRMALQDALWKGDVSGIVYLRPRLYYYYCERPSVIDAEMKAVCSILPPECEVFEDEIEKIYETVQQLQKGKISMPHGATREDKISHLLPHMYIPAKRVRISAVLNEDYPGNKTLLKLLDCWGGVDLYRDKEDFSDCDFVIVDEDALNEQKNYAPGMIAMASIPPRHEWYFARALEIEKDFEAMKAFVRFMNEILFEWDKSR